MKDIFDEAIELLDCLETEGYSTEQIKEIIIRMWLETTTEPLTIRQVNPEGEESK